MSSTSTAMKDRVGTARKPLLGQIFEGTPNKAPGSASSRILTRGRDMISDDRLWCQHQFRDGKRRDMLCAITDASHELGLWEHLNEAYIRLLQEVRKRDYSSLVLFNQTKLHRDVLSVFDSALTPWKV